MKSIITSSSLKINIVSNFVSNGWIATIGLVFIPIYLRYIGSEGYGLIGIFTSLQVVLFLLDSGLSTTLNKELARLSVLPSTEFKMRNLVRTLGGVYWLISFLAGLVAILLSPVLAKYWVIPKDLTIETITNAFLLLSFSIIFQLPTGFYSGGLIGLNKQVTLNIIKVIFATIKSFGAILVLANFSNSIISFFIWNLLITIMQTFTLKCFLWRYLPKSSIQPIFDLNELKSVRGFAFGIAGISITSILLTQIDKIILSKILSLELFGYYAISCSVALTLYQLLTPLTQSFFPKFTNLISLNKIDELIDSYHQACKLISIVILPATFILVFFSKELIFIWTNNIITTNNTWLITSIYAFGTGMNCLMNMPYLLTLSYNWTKLGFYQNLVFLILMIPLNIYLSLEFSALGGALTWAILNCLYFIVTPIIIHKKFLKGELIKWYWNDTLMPLILCVSIIGFCKFLFFVYAFNSNFQLLVLILLGLLTMIAVYLITMSKNNFYKYFNVK